MPVEVIIRHPLPDVRLTASIKKVVAMLVQRCEISKHHVNVVLTSDTEMQALNKQFRKQNRPTNVLSFPFLAGADPIIEPLGFKELGDIVISVDTARREALAENQQLFDKLIHLIVHGFLHLLGYDHERSEQDAAAMSAKENELLLEILPKRSRTMTSLAVNVDHVATIRQARGGDEPDPVTAAALCELAGARGIVVHLREDRRHIQDRDLRLLRETVKTKLNLEMGAAEEIIALALDIKPDMVTLVPEKRRELTTEGGLDVASQKKKLTDTIAKMARAHIPVSLFIDPDLAQIKAAWEVGSTFVEIHTGRYADALTESQQALEFDLIKTAAYEAHQLGLRVNAGHGLNYHNTAPIASLEPIEELSIGHAVISRSLFCGLERAVREMHDIIHKSLGYS